MDEFELRRTVYCYIKEICHYSQMQVFATSFYQKNYFQLQIDETINGLIKSLLKNNVTSTNENFFHSLKQDVLQEFQGIQEQQGQQEHQSQQQILENNIRHFTVEDLANYDGKEGREAYVAVNGKVYDVTKKIRWAGGTHFGLYAGRDLSRQFMECHQGLEERLLTLPQVGVIESVVGNQNT